MRSRRPVAEGPRRAFNTIPVSASVGAPHQRERLFLAAGEVPHAYSIDSGESAEWGVQREAVGGDADADDVATDGTKGGPNQRYSSGGQGTLTDVAVRRGHRRLPRRETNGQATCPPRLSPAFVEALMGLPRGWSKYMPSATPSCPSRQPSPGECSGEG